MLRLRCHGAAARPRDGLDRKPTWKLLRTATPRLRKASERRAAGCCSRRPVQMQGPRCAHRQRNAGTARRGSQRRPLSRGQQPTCATSQRRTSEENFISSAERLQRCCAVRVLRLSMRVALSDWCVSSLLLSKRLFRQRAACTEVGYPFQMLQLWIVQAARSWNKMFPTDWQIFQRGSVTSMPDNPPPVQPPSRNSKFITSRDFRRDDKYVASSPWIGR